MLDEELRFRVHAFAGVSVRVILASPCLVKPGEALRKTEHKFIFFGVRCALLT
jgi:hypothetical protein